MSVVADSTRHSMPAWSKISMRELVPGALAAAGHVVDAVVVAVEQPHEPVGEVAGVGRAADLVA